MKRCVWFLGAIALLSSQSARAQNSCPPIAFYTAPALLTYDNSQFPVTLKGGVRAMGMSYREVDIQLSASAGYPLTVGSDFGQLFAACGFNPGAASTRAKEPDPLGQSAQILAIADFMNNGGYGAAYVGPGIPGGSGVLVGMANSGGVPLPTEQYLAGLPLGVVKAADFNGDGKPDLAAISYNTNPSQPDALQILINKGDGTFGSPVVYSAGAVPESLTAGDFNQDGKIDLAVVGTSGVIVFLGKGDGTFQPGVTYAPGTNPSYDSVVAADLNHDGKLDLAVVDANSSTIVILLGNGNGTFQAPKTFSSVVEGDYIAVGDFNGDGNQDLAMASLFLRSISIFPGKGDGTFDAASTFTAPSPTSLVVADFNGDGKLDIVIGNGVPDLLTGSTDSDEMAVLYGNGDGTFVDAPLYLLRQGPTSVAVADFNGDGRTDAAIGYQLTQKVSLFKGAGGSKFQPLPDYSLTSPSTALVSADFNADGKPDLAIAGSGTLAVALGKGDGTFQAPLQFSAGANLVAIQTADFNGDGKPDLVAADDPFDNSPGLGSVFVFLNAGGGSLNAGASVPAGSHPNAIAIGDFNGDGKPDLAVADNGVPGIGTGIPQTDNGGLSILLNNGGGTFKSPVGYPAGISPLSVATGDLNGDGKLDVVVSTGGANFQYQVAVFLGKGDGTFKGPVYYPTDFGPQSIVIQDFNHDGKADIIVAHCCGETDMTFLLGNGDGTLQPDRHFQGGPSPYALAIADFDRNGTPDLAVANNDGGMSILLNASPAPSAFASVNAASSIPGPVAADSIVSAYGQHLATAPTGAVGSLPTTLAGTTVTVKDAGGTSRPAQLFYVSPAQVNFTIPDGTMVGTAGVTIRAGDGTSQTAPVQIAPVAPGLFSYAGTGGLAAAQITRVHGDGSRDNENVYQQDTSGKLTPLPINLGPSTDQVYLILYGTGIRGRSALSNVSVSMGGVKAQVLYAGPQGAFVGEDQVNVLIPRSLAGKGSVSIALTADGESSNAVNVTIQ